MGKITKDNLLHFARKPLLRSLRTVCSQATCKGSVHDDRTNRIEHCPSRKTLLCSRTANCPRVTLTYCYTSQGGYSLVTLLQNKLHHVTGCTVRFNSFRGRFERSRVCTFAKQARAQRAAWCKVPEHGMLHESLTRLSPPRYYFVTNSGAKGRVRKSSSRALRRYRLRRSSALPR
jgi:hypothetical protein